MKSSPICNSICYCSPIGPMVAKLIRRRTGAFKDLDQRFHTSCHSGAPPISGLPEIGSVSAKSRLTPTFGAKRRRARCFETRTSCAPRHEGLVLRSERSERLEGPGSRPPSSASPQNDDLYDSNFGNTRLVLTGRAALQGLAAPGYPGCEHRHIPGMEGHHVGTISRNKPSEHVFETDKRRRVCRRKTQRIGQRHSKQANAILDGG